MEYLEEVYFRLTNIPIPNNLNILKSAYHIASIAHDLRLVLWMEGVDEGDVQHVITIGSYKIDKLKEYALILSRYPNISYLPILNDSITYLTDVLEELKIEFKLDKGFD